MEDVKCWSQLKTSSSTAPFSFLSSRIQKKEIKSKYLQQQIAKLPSSGTWLHRIPMGAWLFGHTQSNPRICRLILASEVQLVLVTLLFFTLWFCLPPLHQHVYALLVIPEAALLHSNTRLTPNQDNGIKSRHSCSRIQLTHCESK